MRSLYRREARFVMDLAAVSTKLDRNQRARLLHQAEALERSTKAKGRKSGVLGQTGLAVLRALVLGFANRATGLCIPSIQAIREKTGFCKQTVVKAIRALETVGLIVVTRRLIRRYVDRGGFAMLTTVQGSNVYAFSRVHETGRNHLSMFPVGSPSRRLRQALDLSQEQSGRERSHGGRFGGMRSNQRLQGLYRGR
jgi:DNA-binding MarR family transcriptional regulator